MEWGYKKKVTFTIFLFYFFLQREIFIIKNTINLKTEIWVIIGEHVYQSMAFNFRIYVSLFFFILNVWCDAMLDTLLFFLDFGDIDH